MSKNRPVQPAFGVGHKRPREVLRYLDPLHEFLTETCEAERRWLYYEPPRDGGPWSKTEAAREWSEFVQPWYYGLSGWVEK